MSKEEKCENKCTCEDVCACEENKECTCEDTCTCEKDKECTCAEACECGNEHDKKKKCHGKDKDKIHELEEQISILEDRVLREKAELANFRRRKEEETARMLKYSNEALTKEILPILDNFERAINMDDENLEDEVSKFLQGFKMLYCNFVNILEKYEVKEIESLNKPFDATFHQAVMTEKREGVEPGIVVEVLQKGYMLKDKVIRPTMVKVSE